MVDNRVPKVYSLLQETSLSLLSVYDTIGSSCYFKSYINFVKISRLAIEFAWVNFLVRDKTLENL
jgi:hypothetical protein